MIFRMLLVLLALPVGCADPDLTEREWQRLSEHRWDARERPANATKNAVAFDDDAAWLGRDLYFDPRLSGSGDVSCDTCHDADGSGADPRQQPTSVGGSGTPSDRNAPTILNAGLRDGYSWLDATGTLWQQIRKPLSGPFHAIGMDELTRRICGPQGHHRQGYEHVFGPCGTDQQVLDNASRALAAYVRTLETGPSRFDAFVGTSYTSRDRDALDPDEVLGARLFVGKASCNECHSGPLFSDEQRYALGAGILEFDDNGDQLRYKVPPLRMVGLTGPYMHDGSLTTLWDVLDFYAAGGDARAEKPPIELQPLALTDAEIVALGAFLVSLDGQLEHEPCWVAETEACCDAPRPWTAPPRSWDEGAQACR